MGKGDADDCGEQDDDDVDEVMCGWLQAEIPLVVGGNRRSRQAMESSRRLAQQARRYYADQRWANGIKL